MRLVLFVIFLPILSVTDSFGICDPITVWEPPCITVKCFSQRNQRRRRCYERLPTTVTIQTSPTTIAIKPSPSVAFQEPFSHTPKYYLIKYTLPDFHDILQLMKNEVTFESWKSTQAAPDATWSTQSRILVKVGTLFDQTIMLWKDHEKRNKLDVSKPVHTVFEAKYEVEQLIREIGDIFTQAKSTSRKHSAKVLKKNANAKVYLAMSICKSIMDDIIDALVLNYDAFHGNEYNQFFELITKDL